MHSLKRILAAVSILLGSAVLFSASDTDVKLVDVAEQAGVTLQNVAGDVTKDFIIDSVGNGAAWFDFDNDGDLDLLIVNGSTRENMRRGGDPMVALYQNDGKGHFTDSTARSGLTRSGWGMGACVADYDNDGFGDVYVTAWGRTCCFTTTAKVPSRT